MSTIYRQSVMNLDVHTSSSSIITSGSNMVENKVDVSAGDNEMGMENTNNAMDVATTITPDFAANNNLTDDSEDQFMLDSLRMLFNNDGHSPEHAKPKSVSQTDVQFYKKRILHAAHKLLKPAIFYSPSNHSQCDSLPESVLASFNGFLEEIVDHFKSTDRHDICQAEYGYNNVTPLFDATSDDCINVKDCEKNNADNVEDDVNAATMKILNLTKDSSDKYTLNSFLVKKKHITFNENGWANDKSNIDGMGDDDCNTCIDDDDCNSITEDEDDAVQFPRSKVINLKDVRLKTKGILPPNTLGSKKNNSTIYTIYE
jgi:hypothetical protein